MTGEVLVHTWDLARATGASIALDPDLCRAAIGRAKGRPVHQQAPEMFAPPVTVGNAAVLAEELVALYGRDPAWVPPSAESEPFDRRLLATQYATSANLAARVTLYDYLDRTGDPPE